MDANPDDRPGVTIQLPVFIHPTAEVSEAVIGPNASIGANCKISQAVIQDSIIAEGTQVTKVALTHSLIGSNCVVEGQPNKEEASSLNIGDNSEVRFEA
jgi:glucose-1-phosphate thymidylyltransferase